MNTKGVISIISGYTRPMTDRTRALMRDIHDCTAADITKGVKKNLIPANEYKGPKLKLTQHARNQINSHKNLIKLLLKQIDKLEIEKMQEGLSPQKIAGIDFQIEKLGIEIENSKQMIREIKMANYGKQLDELG